MNSKMHSIEILFDGKPLVISFMSLQQGLHAAQVLSQNSTQTKNQDEQTEQKRYVSFLSQFDLSTPLFSSQMNHEDQRLTVNQDYIRNRTITAVASNYKQQLLTNSSVKLKQDQIIENLEKSFPLPQNPLPEKQIPIVQVVPPVITQHPLYNIIHKHILEFSYNSIDSVKSVARGMNLPSSIFSNHNLLIQRLAHALTELQHVDLIKQISHLNPSANLIYQINNYFAQQKQATNQLSETQQQKMIKQIQEAQSILEKINPMRVSKLLHSSIPVFVKNYGSFSTTKFTNQKLKMEISLINLKLSQQKTVPSNELSLNLKNYLNSTKHQEMVNKHELTLFHQQFPAIESQLILYQPSQIFHNLQQNLLYVHLIEIHDKIYKIYNELKEKDTKTEPKIQKSKIVKPNTQIQQYIMNDTQFAKFCQTKNISAQIIANTTLLAIAIGQSCVFTEAAVSAVAPNLTKLVGELEMNELLTLVATIFNNARYVIQKIGQIKQSQFVLQSETIVKEFTEFKQKYYDTVEMNIYKFSVQQLAAIIGTSTEIQRQAIKLVTPANIQQPEIKIGVQ
ncbi:Hypothetical_protein [Hexamita inflata]|uniref:Hypothetical_protein n=1 Tax=Hexamita inflata TaxID=28002 RepID=A0AA86UV66_9EUKA|nr:Hypothetical protein HINF_LOCUS53581 [Hexamita inflata]